MQMMTVVQEGVRGGGHCTSNLLNLGHGDGDAKAIFELGEGVEDDADCDVSGQHEAAAF